MGSRISVPGTSFANVLRSYQTGGVTYTDFLAHVDRQLAAGASPLDMLTVLRRRELIEPLPDHAHDALTRLLNSAAAAADAPESGPEPAAAVETDEALDPTVPVQMPVAARSNVASDSEQEPLPLHRATLMHGPDPAADPKLAPAEGEPERVLDAESAADPHPDPLPSFPELVIVEPIVNADRLIADVVMPTEPAVIEPAGPSDAWAAASGGLGARQKTWALVFAAAFVLVAGWFYFRSVAKEDVSHPVAETVPAASAPLPAAVPKAGTVLHDCAACPAMTVLPPGRFKQGSAATDPHASAFERPQHVVLIRDSLAISTNEVTVREFGEFATATGRDMQGCDTYDGEWHRRSSASWQEPGFVQTPNHPVTCVSWNDALAYVQWLSAKSGHRYRLPSASEWEYAARAGRAAAQPWSANGSDACAIANVADRSAARRFPGWKVFACRDGYINTAPVGSFKANAFGINDMLGNVFEWTEDCWHADYVKAPVDGSARRDGDWAERELRRGSWFSSPAYVRNSYRNHFAADYRSSSVGLRVARELTP